MTQLNAGQATDLLIMTGAAVPQSYSAEECCMCCSLEQVGLKCDSVTDSPGKPVKNVDS